MSNLKYSVLMTVYKNDNASFFKESIMSMISQTKKPDEIVIVKDGLIPKSLQSVIDEATSISDDEIMKRQSVRPGLTGLAQVKGRNNISWEEKFKYDLEYIEKITFFKDIKIIFKTVFKVIKSSDITTEGMATAEDYGDYLLRNKKVSQEEYARKIEGIIK